MIENVHLSAEAAIRTLRIIVAALMLGVLSFTGVVLFVTAGAGPMRETWMLIALAALACGLAIAYPIVRRVSVHELRRRVRGDDSGEAEPKLLGGYTTLTVIGAAMIEGPTLFACVIYLLSADRLALLGVAIGLVLLIGQWPSEERYRSFTERVAGGQPS